MIAAHFLAHHGLDADIDRQAQRRRLLAQPLVERGLGTGDADLVDIVATGNEETQCAIARRVNLPASVCAAIAEVGSASAALVSTSRRRAWATSLRSSFTCSMRGSARSSAKRVAPVALAT